MLHDRRRRFEASDVVPMFPTLCLEGPDRAGPARHAAREDPGGDGRHARRLPALAPGHGWQSGQRCIGARSFGISSSASTTASPRSCDSCASATTLRDHRLLDHRPGPRIGAPAAQPPQQLSQRCLLCLYGAGRRHPQLSRPSAADRCDPAAGGRTHGQNTDQVVMKVRDGTLLMFPSYLSIRSMPTRVTRNESASAST